MLLKTSWLKYLWKERKPFFLRQAFRMAFFHKTPFRSLLDNILRLVEEFHAGFTFPIVASAALRNPEMVRLILDFHQEVASHGFNHVNYRYLPPNAERMDIGNSLSAFRNLRTPVRGFRAPYNVCTDQTPRLLEELGFLWEGSLGLRSPHCDERNFFRVHVDGHMSSFTCIPMFKWSDDRMMDIYGLSNRQMAKILKRALQQTEEKSGVIMFDLHPVRMGQPNHIDVLREVIAYGMQRNGWFPRVTEAVEYWLTHHGWKDGASYCCLLTGDIDSLTLLDYLSRLF